MTQRRSVLSLFSGCGGMDLGFVRAGFHINLALDNWDMAVRTYLANSKLLGKDALQRSVDLKDREIGLDDLPWSEVIIGGPPCQGFSFAGKQFLDDSRNRLYLNFVDIVRRKQPRAFVMENVRGMEAMALAQVKNAFSAAGYVVTHELVNAVDFGIGQRRQRLIVVGFRRDLNIEFDHLTRVRRPRNAHVSILDAIGDLPPPVEASQDDPYALNAPIPNHAYKALPPSVQAFVRHVPNGGCFRDAPRETLPDRLKRILDNPARYRSPRLFPKPDPNEPSQTIPADTNPSLGGVLAPDLFYKNGVAMATDQRRNQREGVYTSPLPSRRITPREAARLQSFPDTFVFEGSLSAQHRLIGNAVPVRLAETYAKAIMSCLEELDSKQHPLKRPSR